MKYIYFVSFVVNIDGQLIHENLEVSTPDIINKLDNIIQIERELKRTFKKNSDIEMKNIDFSISINNFILLRTEN